MENDLKKMIIEASKTGDVDTLQQIVEENGEKSILLDGNPNEATALHYASAGGALHAVEFLLSSPIGADPRAARNNNFTPLHAAAMFGHSKICTVLIDAGALVNVQTDPQAYSPLHSASFGGHLDTIQVLLARGANPNLINYRGERPVDTAKRQGQIDAQLLLESEQF